VSAAQERDQAVDDDPAAVLPADRPELRRGDGYRAWHDAPVSCIDSMEIPRAEGKTRR
jgi:hypothetical protein